tara:strand:+ start:13541 stop:14290 length:750 start_codon:yes stop_codon:yes gene_type:complete
MFQIDLNSDVGEGIGNEAVLMPYLSSCNIACGAHAGDAKTIKKVIDLAIQHGVKIGAHPSYPDRANFGRKEMKMTAANLKKSIRDQITLVANSIPSGQTGMKGQAALHHIKPHGALYNKAAKDEVIATIIIETIEEFNDQLCLFVPYNSVIADLAKGRLPIMVEGFADRNYNEDYSLVARSQIDAVLKDPEAVWKHIFSMITENKLHTIKGVIKPFHIDTLCVHGDTATAIGIIKHLHLKCKQHQISIV